MRKYDFKAVKEYIQTHSDCINEASLGMKEDWFYTAQKPTWFSLGCLSGSCQDRIDEATIPKIDYKEEKN